MGDGPAVIGITKADIEAFCLLHNQVNITAGQEWVAVVSAGNKILALAQRIAAERSALWGGLNHPDKPKTSEENS